MEFRLPRINDTRIVKRFALFPIECRFSTTAKWLTVCYIHQSYISFEGWKNNSWATKEEYQRFKNGEVYDEEM